MVVIGPIWAWSWRFGGGLRFSAVAFLIVADSFVIIEELDAALGASVGITKRHFHSSTSGFIPSNPKTRPIVKTVVIMPHSINILRLRAVMVVVTARLS